MIINVEPNILSDANHYYSGWKYPTVDSYDFISNTGKWDQPEFIRPDIQDLRTKCKVNGAVGCALIVGIIGTSDEESSYRLKGFYSDNRILTGVPTNRSTEQESVQGNQYDYFWFSIPKG